MKAKWWSCVLGLLCMPAEVILNRLTASQSPLSISSVWVNSSLEIKCATSLENPLGFSLKRRFVKDEQILYLSFSSGVVTKNTTAVTFENRITITQETPSPEAKHSFKLQLFLLHPDDTDLYYCSWNYMSKNYQPFLLESNGTVIIVREGEPVKECSDHTVDLILICLSIMAFTGILLIVISLMIVRFRRFKKRFTPYRTYDPPLAPRPPRPPRPSQPQHIYLQQHTVDHCPYMMTSTNNCGMMGNL